MWNKLSMAEKAGIIALGVQSGITNLSEIQQLYNESQKQDQEYTPKRKFYDGGEKEKRIEIRRGVNGITSPEVLAVVNGEDEYNKWVEEHPQFKEVPNNFITEATSSLPELEVTDNKDGTVTTSFGNYRNTRNKDNYTITDWWNSVPRSLDRQWNDFLQTDPIFGQRRVNNYRKALQRNPQFSDNWDMASNIAEGVNIMSGGIFNRLSPTQNIGLIIDTANGKNFMNSWFGNSGIVSDNFAQQHPYLSFGINALGDFGTYYLPRGIKPALQGVQQLETTAARHLKNAKSSAAVNEGVILPDKTIRVRTSPSRSIYDDYDFEQYSKNLSVTPAKINNEAQRYYDRVVQPLLKTDRPLFNEYNKKAIILDEVPGEPENVQGIHFSDNGENIVTRKGKDMISTGIHEVVSHGTDDILSQEVVQEYDDLINKLLDTYQGPVTNGSRTPAEFRATMNEIRKQLQKYWLKKGNVDLNELDKVSDTDLLKLMRETNGYGVTYQRAYKQLPEQEQSKWMLQFRKALKTLPIVGGIFTGLQNNEEN